MAALRLIVIFGFPLLYVACSRSEITAPSPPPRSSPSITSDEYSVLAALMDSLLGRTSVDIIVLYDSTDSGVFLGSTDSALTVTLAYVSQNFPELESETVMDYKAKNLEHAYIDDPKKVYTSCLRASQTDKVFPSCQVSRVGLAADGEQALVYVGMSWAPLAGGGAYYLLSRINGSWIVIRSVGTWIS